MPCHVCECLASISPRLKDPELPSHYLLVNGKVEKQLKYFVRGQHGRRRDTGAPT
jgi:hypothetical protein